jgi:hypothetical protein
MRGDIMVGIGLIMAALGILMGPQIGKISFLLLFVGLIPIGLGVSLMMTKRRPTNRDVFIKCTYCRAKIPIDSEKCPICAADLK